MAELEIRYEDLDDIISADSNPKDHDLGVLYQSMKNNINHNSFLIGVNWLPRDI